MDNLTVKKITIDKGSYIPNDIKHSLKNKTLRRVIGTVNLTIKRQANQRTQLMKERQAIFMKQQNTG